VVQAEPADRLVQPERLAQAVLADRLEQVGQVERAVRLAQPEHPAAVVHPVVVVQQEPVVLLEHREHPEVAGLLVQAEIQSPRLAR
jgi:hypothetical protein